MTTIHTVMVIDQQDFKILFQQTLQQNAINLEIIQPFIKKQLESITTFSMLEEANNYIYIKYFVRKELKNDELIPQSSYMVFIANNDIPDDKNIKKIFMHLEDFYFFRLGTENILHVLFSELQVIMRQLDKLVVIKNSDQYIKQQLNLETSSSTKPVIQAITHSDPNIKHSLNKSSTHSSNQKIQRNKSLIYSTPGTNITPKKKNYSFLSRSMSSLKLTEIQSSKKTSRPST